MKKIKYGLLLVDGPDETRRSELLKATHLFDLSKPIVIDDMQVDWLKDMALQLAKIVGRPFEIIQGLEKQFMVIP